MFAAAARVPTFWGDYKEQIQPGSALADFRELAFEGAGDEV
jgi:hypothetical protein